jgi:hypothetical protein
MYQFNPNIGRLMAEHEISAFFAGVGYDVGVPRKTSSVVRRTREVRDSPGLVEAEFGSTATKPALNTFTASPLLVRGI